MSYRYLLDIALILLTTRIFGLLTRRFHLPQVVGALIAGLVFGPAVLNILNGTEFLTQLSELGVIVILFSAGLETDLAELRRSGRAGFWVALLGVLVPLVGGTVFGYILSGGGEKSLLESIFIGVALTATSVSITVETLKEMGRLSTKVGNTILAAALIDDVLGLICLTVASSFAGDTASEGIGRVLIKILFFFVFAGAVGYAVHAGIMRYCRYKKSGLRHFTVFSLVLCLLMAYVAEHFFGVADIIGAFAAGLAISSTGEAPYIQSRVRHVSDLMLTPIFFASIGINFVLPPMSGQLVLASLVLLAIAVASKLVGCGLGAKLCGMTLKESVQVGVGMVCRGEVALIVINKGQAMGLIPPIFLGPVVIVVVLTTVLTPMLLKLAYRSDDRYAGLEESALVNRAEVASQLEDVSQRLLELDLAMQSPFAEKRGGDKKSDNQKGE